MLPGMAPDGLREAVDSYHQAQQELVEARNRLARAIAGAAMSGMTRDEIVDDRISRRSGTADLAGGVDQRSRDRLTAFAGLPECRRRIRFTDRPESRTDRDGSVMSCYGFRRLGLVHIPVAATTWVEPCGPLTATREPLVSPWRYCRSRGPRHEDACCERAGTARLLSRPG